MTSNQRATAKSFTPSGKAWDLDEKIRLLKHFFSELSKLTGRDAVLTEMDIRDWFTTVGCSDDLIDGGFSEYLMSELVTWANELGYKLESSDGRYWTVKVNLDKEVDVV